MTVLGDLVGLGDFPVLGDFVALGDFEGFGDFPSLEGRDLATFLGFSADLGVVAFLAFPLSCPEDVLLRKKENLGRKDLFVSLFAAASVHLDSFFVALPPTIKQKKVLVTT